MPSPTVLLRFASALSGLLLGAAAPAAMAAPIEDVAIPNVVTPGPAAVAPTAEPVGGLYIVDVLVLFTPRIESFFGDAEAVRDEAERLTRLANQYNVNSRIPVEYRIVGDVARSEVTAEEVSFFDNQDALANSSDVRAARDAAGADLIVLLRTLDGVTDSLCGLAGLFNGGDQTDPPENVDPERDAFQVVATGMSENGLQCDPHVYAHELGHALGAGHAYEISGDAYWKPYAHGAQCAGAGNPPQYSSIMYGLIVNITNNEDDGLNSLPIGDYFTNPELLAADQACGADVGGPVGANNARSMTEAVPYVAAYRASTKSLPKGSGLLLGAFSPAALLALLLAGLLIRRAKAE